MSKCSYREITTKFDGVCRECGETIEAGETVAWKKGKGIWHMECAERVEGDDSIYINDGDGEPFFCNECGRAYHKRTNNSCCSSCNSQYEQGKAEAERYLMDKKIYGEAWAERWEMEAELARYNRGEDDY